VASDRASERLARMISASAVQRRLTATKQQAYEFQDQARDSYIHGKGMSKITDISMASKNYEQLQ
jgi:hypothetical protein